jgi:hypothetical protein
MTGLLTLLLVAGGTAPPDAGLSEELCAERFVPALRKQLAVAFPNHRLPRRADYEPDMLEWLFREFMNECFAVTEGDFNGDRQPDLALLLKDTKSADFILVVALRKGDSFALTQLPHLFCSVKDPCYLKAVPPGLYEQDESGPDPEGLLKLRIPHTGIDSISETGDREMDVSQCVYGLVKGKWLSVQVR